MKLIRHTVFVELENDEWILINSLNGMIDKVNSSVYNVLRRWSVVDEIIPEDEFEIEVYKNLENRGYLVENELTESEKKELVLKKLRDNHNNDKMKYKCAIFVLSYNCNFRCPYCFESNSVKNRSILTKEQIDAAINISDNQITHVGLFGGEPLLPENKGAVEYIVNKLPDKTYFMYTNGYYLRDFFDIISKLKIEHITVTLDGDEDAHDKRRYLEDGSGTFKKIINGIEYYLENKININIRMNIDDTNIHESTVLRAHLLDKFSKYAKYLSFEMANMLGDSYSDRTEIVTKLFKDDIMLSEEERLRRNKMLRGFNPITAAFTTSAKCLKPMYSFCSAHHESVMVFDPFGDIYSCLVSLGNKDFSIGSYYPEKVLKKESLHTRNIETIPSCRECIYSLLCGGGCSMLLNSSNDIYKPSCAAIKYQIHELIPRFYKDKLNLANKVQA